MNNRGLSISDFDMSHCSAAQGDVAALNGPKEEFETLISFVIPPGTAPTGKFEIDYKGSQVEIEIETIESPEQDAVFQFGKDFHVGHLQLPFVEVTDNRGVYPCLIVSMSFPYRLASWMDPSHESGLKLDLDYEELAVTGVPKSTEKVAALVVLNKLIRQHMGTAGATLPYDSVTVFMECYFLKQPEEMVLKKLTFLAAESAYKNAIAPHVLKDFHQAEIKEAINLIAGSVKSSPITSEMQLLDVIHGVIENVIRHHIENRRWISAFWDGERTIQVDGSQVSVPREPKRETEIQPTLYVLLYETLSPLGIHVVPEADEGIGRIDFRCLFTTANGVALSAAVEFKLAHHGELQKGIRRQLPAYLKATKSSSGIYTIMWFKDSAGKYWKEPRNQTLDGLTNWVTEEAQRSSRENAVSILSSVIDASVKPSASKL